MSIKKPMNSLTTTWNREDRDLLIELRTEMKGVRTDIKTLSNGTAERLTLLEQGKLDRTEANRLQSETLKVQTNHEERLRTVEDDSMAHKTQIKTILTVGGGIFAALQIALQIGLNFFLH